MSQSNNYCVIMAGGIGSRFWPMSTQKYPKQFQDILGTGRTMIQQTYDRISQIVPQENIYVITNKEYVSLTEQQLPELNSENIVGEPMMKNTAACNLYMAKKIADKNPEANMIVLPADHLILKDSQTGTWYLLRLLYIDYVEFMEPINYSHGFSEKTF